VFGGERGAGKIEAIQPPAMEMPLLREIKLVKNRQKENPESAFSMDKKPSRWQQDGQVAYVETTPNSLGGKVI